MSEASPVDKGGASECARYGQSYDAGDLFCRNCGLEVRDDAGAIEAYLAKVVPVRVDAILKDRFRDQKVVEVETASKHRKSVVWIAKCLQWASTLIVERGRPANPQIHKRERRNEIPKIASSTS
jgi:hypothetical protein